MLSSKTDGKQYPFYIKATVILFGLILLIYALKVLEDILVPFAIAGLFAILLNPLNNLMERRLPRVIAIIFTVALAILFLGGLFYFLSAQMAMFKEALPLLKQKFLLMVVDVEIWLNHQIGYEVKKPTELLSTAMPAPAQMSQTVGTIIGAVGIMIIIPVYIFLILLYKPLILDFLFMVFKEENSLRVAEILAETKSAIQSYIMGLLIETAIVAGMNSIALLLLNVPYAILLGVLGGILNMIPYIGGIVAIALPVLMATVTKEGYSTQLAIIAAYSVIQLIDNNILVPRIISSKVQINALFSIIIVLAGGALWGISGMFLSIPFVAVIKIIFDRVDDLKPWGHLLGDKIPEQHSGVAWQKKWVRIFKKKSKHSA